MGHVLSASSWLDAHFEACRPEYGAMFAWAGLEPGVRILDAGCGTGSYIPLLFEAGAGEVIALDTAIEHLRPIGADPAGSKCLPICGSIGALPISDASVDAVWCANTLQYSDDEDAIEVLRDFGRVVRPHGIVALKDVDMTGFKFSPAPPLIGLHLAEACAFGRHATSQSRGSIRGRDLRSLLVAAGLTDVRQCAFVIERFGPLSGYDAQFWSEWLPYLAGLAEVRGVPEDDLATWRKVATPKLAAAYTADPAFYGCEVQVVCTGRAPG